MQQLLQNSCGKTAFWPQVKQLEVEHVYLHLIVCKKNNVISSLSFWGGGVLFVEIHLKSENVDERCSRMWFNVFYLLLIQLPLHSKKQSWTLYSSINIHVLNAIYRYDTLAHSQWVWVVIYLFAENTKPCFCYCSQMHGGCEDFLQ